MGKPCVDYFGKTIILIRSAVCGLLCVGKPSDLFVYIPDGITNKYVVQPKALQYTKLKRHIELLEFFRRK